VPRHWAVLISDLRQISPIGFIVNFCLVAFPARGHLATCRHVPRETRVAVPYHTWRYPALLSRTPFGVDAQLGFSAGALAGFISTDFRTENENMGSRCRAPCALNSEVTFYHDLTRPMRDRLIAD
jgi:hypothetical protein